MRKVAKKLREDAVELEDLKVTVRKEDVALKPFSIPLQDVSMQQLQSRDMVTIRKVVLPGIVRIVNYLNSITLLLILLNIFTY